MRNDRFEGLRNLRARFLDYYSALSTREQRMFVLLACVAGLALFLTCLWQPVERHLASSQIAYVQQTNLLKLLQDTANNARGPIEHKPVEDSQEPLPVLITHTAANYSISIKRLETDNKSAANLLIENAGFNQLVRWLNELVTSHHVQIQSTVITKTATPGTVNAMLKLKN